MRIKRVQFTPDATIRAAEAGGTITHIPMTCTAGHMAEADGTFLVQFGMPPEYWDIVIHLLRNSKNLHGEAVAEGFINAINEWSKA